MHSKTNILVLKLPDRYNLNLNTNSCVNREGKVFNRKVRKYMKAIECALTVEVSYSRNHYTRHGLYLNNRVKNLLLGNSTPHSTKSLQ
jgi:hypothetical protein